MINDFSWVDEKKRQAIAERLQNRGMPRYAQRPLSEKHGISYTGSGPNGEVDRSAPAGITVEGGRPHMFHQGEARVRLPEGSVYLNADIAPVAAPAAEGRWADSMRRMRGSEGGMPGFESGGGIVNEEAVDNAVGGTNTDDSQRGRRWGQNRPNPFNPDGSGQRRNTDDSRQARPSFNIGGWGQSQTNSPGVNPPRNASDSNGTETVITPVNAQETTLYSDNNPNGEGVGSNPNPQAGNPNPQAGNPNPQTGTNTADPNFGFKRGVEGTWRINDMNQQNAAVMAAQQHQQAMRGIDANAAWAQDRMLQAQQEEGVNKFAAEYAFKTDAENWNRVYATAWEYLSSGDPALVAKGAEMMQWAMPGSEVDWSNQIYSAGLKQAMVWKNAGVPAEEIGKRLKAAYPGWSDTDINNIVTASTLTEYQRDFASWKQDNPDYQGLSQLAAAGDPAAEAELLELTDKFYEDYMGGSYTRGADGQLRFTPADTGNVDWATTSPYLNDDANKILKDPKHPDYARVINSIVTHVTNPAHLASYYGTTAWKDIEAAIKADPSKHTIIGSKTQPKSDKNPNRYKNLDAAYENGQVVLIEGRLAYVTGYADEGRDKERVYTLQIIGESEPIHFSTNRGYWSTGRREWVNWLPVDSPTTT